MLYTIAKTVVLPPTCFFVLLFAGWLLKRRWRQFGQAFLAALLLIAYLATTPFVAGELMAPLQTAEPIDLANPDPDIDAIVVLGAGVYYGAPEYQPTQAGTPEVPTADSLSLERLEYAAHLARTTGNPVMVSGGPLVGLPNGPTLAQVMQATLQRDFGVPARWIEDQSDNTKTNAVLSAALLRDNDVRRIYLVTHAWHMPRAVIAFKGTGIEVVPAPTRFVSRSDVELQDFIPSAKALLVNFYAAHEWLGILWYRLHE